MPAHDDLAWAVTDINARRPGYAKFYRYADGDHPLIFPSNSPPRGFYELFRRFRENLCPATYESVADRLEVVGFDVESGDQQAAEAAEAWWQRERLDRRQNEVSVEFLKAGDAYGIVWPDRDQPNRARFWPQPAHLCTIRYDEETEQPELGAKLWRLRDGSWRLNLYYPSVIEKWQAPKGDDGDPKPDAFTPYEDPTQPNPYGRVPLFHFPNGEFARHGRSELVDVIPIQDALNYTVITLLYGVGKAALPNRWMTGGSSPTDERTGEPRGFSDDDDVWEVPHEQARFGQFPTPEFDKILEVNEAFAARIARIRGIPLHYFNLHTGDFPSGESLKTAEGRHVKHVERVQASAGTTWEDVAGFAAQIETGTDAGARLSTRWKTAETRNEMNDAERVEVMRRVGISRTQALRELGFSDEQVDRIVQERRDEDQFEAQLDTLMPTRG